jgi:regulatory protein
MKPARLSKEQALQKARHYCAYQERCHQEVKEKLYSFGLHRDEVDQLISSLIEDGYLDEERFAVQFAGGKFRMKHWGKRRIESELRARNVSAYCIRKALAQIPEDDYLIALQKLALEKQESLSGETAFMIRGKTTAYLIQKGYEPEIINRVLKGGETD